MREVTSTCPRCGRSSFVRVDAWSGTPDAALDQPCPDGCAPAGHRRRREHGGRGRAGLGPLLFGLLLLVAPIVGVLEALSR